MERVTGMGRGRTYAVAQVVEAIARRIFRAINYHYSTNEVCLPLDGTE